MNRIISPEYAAAKIISDWRINHPSQIKIDLIVSEKDIILKEKPDIGSQARLISFNDHSIITINSRIQYEQQKRFAIAHELGHFELHQSKNEKSFFEDQSFFDWHGASRKELEANRFAAELLMPSDIFSEFCAKKWPSIDEIKTLASVFNTSLTSTAIKYVTHCAYPCILLFSEDKVIKWYYSSKDFPYRTFGKGDTLQKNSFAHDCFLDKESQDKPEIVESSAWLNDYTVQNNFFLNEHSLFIESYNIVLSLIWVN